MKMRPLSICMVIICWAATLLIGCSHSPRVTFYTLESAANAVTAPPGTTSLSVAVGPVTLPVLVDRPQLVIHTATNRVDIFEMHRWAEPLKSGIGRIIAANMALLLPRARVSSYPQNAGLDADYRVLVDIQRLEMTVGQGVVLEAPWAVRPAGTGEANSGRSLTNEPATTVSCVALVAAQGRVLASLSHDLARVVQEASGTQR